MRKIKFIESVTIHEQTLLRPGDDGFPDGRDIPYLKPVKKTFDEGSTYELEDKIADGFLQNGQAVLIRKKKVTKSLNPVKQNK